MKTLLADAKFSFMSDSDRAFIAAFDEEMSKRGYGCGGTIGNGACWGKYMIVYRKTGARSRNVYARIYIRDKGIVLRLFLNKVDGHRQYIEDAAPHIKEVFVGDEGRCYHHHDKNGFCRFRKSYTLDGRLIEKCNGRTFEFHQPTMDTLTSYTALFDEFFASRYRSRA